MTEQEDNLANAVIEIEEVEYLIDEIAANKITRGEETIPLIRLVDNEIRTISLENILKIIREGGIIDHIGV